MSSDIDDHSINSWVLGPKCLDPDPTLMDDIQYDADVSANTSDDDDHNGDSKQFHQFGASVRKTLEAKLDICAHQMNVSSDEMDSWKEKVEQEDARFEQLIAEAQEVQEMCTELNRAVVKCDLAEASCRVAFGRWKEAIEKFQMWERFYETIWSLLRKVDGLMASVDIVMADIDCELMDLDEEPAASSTDSCSA
ncbi:hypothetical protein BT63DRAFT_426114 [Microthyrium microscopicum]|uniref:Uncharacterized protein n=1 Tax=Microthyrium microscopicum TaxID=703497 RepID=A0A6A6UD64_9PEZI|nr:hypothetical protein BT63DRAFT_426114 [Microthyrium microscopicum]